MQRGLKTVGLLLGYTTGGLLLVAGGLAVAAGLVFGGFWLAEQAARLAVFGP